MVEIFISQSKILEDSVCKGQPTLTKAENTHHRGEYHCIADLLFDWFGFDQTSKFNISKAAKSKQNKQDVSQKIALPLKLVFSDQSF